MMINSDAPPPTFEASVLQAPPYTVHPTASTFAGKNANMFVSVGTGNHPFALFLRNDGAVVMTTNGQMPGIVINPPPGVRYVIRTWSGTHTPSLLSLLLALLAS